MSVNSYSSKFNINNELQLRQRLEADGFILKPFDYAFWRAQNKEVNVTLYKSGKILVQGKGTVEFTNKYLITANQLNLGLKVSTASVDDKINHDFNCWIGTDESGKGDYFGPLIIAGVLIDKSNEQKFIDLGIKDSKKLNDNQIEILASKIKANCVFSVVTINPQKYNELYSKFNNLNKLLAWGHARAIENILEKHECENAISDKFGDESLIKKALLNKGKNINLIQRVRAESDMAVAAASILARSEFVKRINQLSSLYGLVFPKGASEKVVEQANLFIKKQGYNKLADVAKLHFKTTKNLRDY